jgi:hypothetical protein
MQPGFVSAPDIRSDQITLVEDQTMKSSKASAVLAVLMYSQGLLGFAAVAAVLMKQPEPAGIKKGSMSISIIESAPKMARVAG